MNQSVLCLLVSCINLLNDKSIFLVSPVSLIIPVPENSKLTQKYSDGDNLKKQIEKIESEVGLMKNIVGKKSDENAKSILESQSEYQARANDLNSEGDGIELKSDSVNVLLEKKIDHLEKQFNSSLGIEHKNDSFLGLAENKKEVEAFDDIVEMVNNRLSQKFDHLEKALNISLNEKNLKLVTSQKNKTSSLPDPVISDGKLQVQVNPCDFFLHSKHTCFKKVYLGSSVILSLRTSNTLSYSSLITQKIEWFREEVNKGSLLSNAIVSADDSQLVIAPVTHSEITSKFVAKVCSIWKENDKIMKYKFNVYFRLIVNL